MAVKSKARILTLILYFPACLFVYLGWIFHHSYQPTVLQYTTRYFCVLVALPVVFALPWAVRYYARVAGWRTVATVLAATLVVYETAALRYYATQTHVFEPFLQNFHERWTPPAGAKDGRTFRILALGGSTTQNRDLPADARYPNVAGAILTARYPQARFEVLNLSADWYTAKHSLIAYTTEGYRFEPDLITVMQGINDLTRSFSPEMFAVGDYDERWTHYFGPAINGARPPMFETYLFGDFLRQWYSDFRYLATDMPLENFKAATAFDAYLRQIVQYARSDDAEIVLLTEPYLYKDEMTEQEQATLWINRRLCVERRSFWRHEYPDIRSMRRAMAAFDDVTRLVARTDGTLLVDTEQAVPKTLEYFVDDVHFTAEGSQEMGRRVAAAIIESGVVPRRLAKHGM